jgi:hypothetical protein
MVILYCKYGPHKTSIQASTLDEAIARARAWVTTLPDTFQDDWIVIQDWTPWNIKIQVIAYPHSVNYEKWREAHWMKDGH